MWARGTKGKDMINTMWAEKCLREGVRLEAERILDEAPEGMARYLQNLPSDRLEELSRRDNSRLWQQRVDAEITRRNLADRG